MFPLIQSGHPLGYGVAVVFTYALIGIVMGPLAAFIPEIFPTRYRYTGAGVAYNFGGVIGGALPPVISPMLLAAYGDWSVAAMMAGFTLVSLVSVLLLTETAGRGLQSISPAMGFARRAAA